MLMDKKIGVLMGGTSAEREVSLKSGRAVSDALKSFGLNVIEIDVGHDIATLILEYSLDVAFIALHGGTGEDGSIQGMLEVMGIPYTGSGVLASSIAMDKLVTKELFAFNNIKVPDFEVIETVGQGLSKLSFPVVVKPSREGSSIGVEIAKTWEEFDRAVSLALGFEGVVLVEECIEGQEVQIAVLNDRALGGVEIRTASEFYDYKAKYESTTTKYILPPELSAELYERAKQTGLAAHRALRCGGATRVDLIIDKNGEIYALEVNTIPGMTETSLLPKIAEQAGLEFPALLQEIIISALDGEEGK